MEKTCGKCGNTDEAEIRFCTKCGEPYEMPREEEDDDVNRTTLGNWITVQSWFTYIPKASGQSENVKKGVLVRLANEGIPGLKSARTTLDIGLGDTIKSFFKGNLQAAQEFILVESDKVPGYAACIGARDYGQLLLVSWYLVADKSRLPIWAKIANVAAMGHANFMELSIYESEELSAVASIIHEATKGAVEEVMKNLNLDFSKVDTKSRGILIIS
jgi:hypothetical protein